MQIHFLFFLNVCIDHYYHYQVDEQNKVNSQLKFAVYIGNLFKYVFLHFATKKFLENQHKQNVCDSKVLASF